MNGLYKDSRQVTVRHITMKKKRGNTQTKWMDDAESDLRNMGVQRCNTNGGNGQNLTAICCKGSKG
jgi:hypothetical protein